MKIILQFKLQMIILKGQIVLSGKNEDLEKLIEF